MDLPSDLHSYTLQSWNEMAYDWIKMHGENGNQLHTELVSPTAEKLLAVCPGQDEILEIACGSGIFVKRLHQLGAKYIVATDFSHEFIKATMKICEGLSNIEFLCLDATNDQAIVEQFGMCRFDKAICNMGIMDMSEIDPLFSAMFKILKHGGSFVFTIMHPCFNGNVPVKGIDKIRHPITFTPEHKFYIKQTEYLQWKPSWGLGIPEQRVKQIFFHRPLHELFAIIFKNGFVIDGFEEPSFKPSQLNQEKIPEVKWSNYTQFPPILGIRCKKY